MATNFNLSPPFGTDGLIIGLHHRIYHNMLRNLYTAFLCKIETSTPTIILKVIETNIRYWISQFFYSTKLEKGRKDISHEVITHQVGNWLKTCDSSNPKKSNDGHICLYAASFLRENNFL